ncbi:MAG: LCP family protein [Lachnospiraceae bacterium]|nr:LCP family protein [Lachnospiraceae bacterium]
MNQRTSSQLHRDMEEDMQQSLRAERFRRKRHRVLQRLLAWLLVIVLVIAIVVLAVSLYISRGGRRLRERTAGAAPNLELQKGEGAGDSGEDTYVPQVEANWQEGWVRYQDKVYEYNEDILTFLVMGIDKMEEVSESEDEVSGGQSDALFLVIANPDDGSIKILAVNRDTMTDIVMYNAGVNGSSPTVSAQIAAQHGFGDGKELSCELTRDAVSRLFFDLPIHGYVSVNMAAIPELNDALGGVDVTSLEDLSRVIKGAKEGAELHLEGMDAFWYVKYRDTKVFESARGRLARQKQYLTAFMSKAIAATKKDITLPINLYGKLKQYMVTDVTTDELAYLASELVNYSFDQDAIYTMEGTTSEWDGHEQFHPDYDALRDLMIRLFYREVDPEGQQ